jgi:predicted Zn finger-like uncharacterized protein
MADRYQTQCPHCGVKFQITAQQLQLANGTVRCGSCLQVFQASQHLVPLTDAPRPGSAGGRATAAPARPAAPPAKPAAPARPAAPTRPAPPTAAADDEDLVDAILREIDSKPAAPVPAARPAGTPRATPPAPAKPAAGEPSWTPPPGKPAAATTDPQWSPPPRAGGAPGADEPKWSPPPGARKEKPAARPGEERNDTRISIGAGEIDDSLLSTEDPFGASAASHLHVSDNEAADESWAKQLLGEEGVGLDEREQRVRSFQIKADDLSLTDQTGVQPRSGLAARLAGVEAEARSRNQGAAEADIEDELDFLNDGGLTMKDVELPTLDAGEELGAAAFSHQVSWGREVFWGILSLVFALVLLGQYLAFNFDELARDSGWRGVYAAACGAGLCELPGNSDVSRIQGANLVVRSDPSAGGVLIVDAVVFNRAPHAQPFPRLELGFTDSAGNPVAGRVFTPEEYLKGEAAGYGEMPPDTPVHLSLQVRAPGIDTGNYAYQLRFLPAGENSEG